MNYGQLLGKPIAPSVLSDGMQSEESGMSVPSTTASGNVRTSSALVQCSVLGKPVLHLMIIHCIHRMAASQIFTRLAELYSLPYEYPRLTPAISTSLISQYVTYVLVYRTRDRFADRLGHRFYNCIWLILNDIIIGWTMGAGICEHAPFIARILDERIRVSLGGSVLVPFWS